MKCEECGGTGKVSKYFYERTDFGKYEKVCGDVVCEECNGTGKIQQTNEEWFIGLSTEEKAEFLVMIQMSVMHPVKRGAVDMDKFIEEVVDWLKNPHKWE